VHVPKIEIGGQITKFSRAIPQVRQRGNDHREVFGPGPSPVQSRAKGISSARTTNSKSSDCGHSVKASTRPGNAITEASCSVASAEILGESAGGRASSQADSD
jgi:hypothetical protein